ncbi:hypothetical protein BX616_005133 [Lobosporangium transversale]|nr:hypothetical protein BX616_005133 [Lobosporangium transversale]
MEESGHTIYMPIMEFDFPNPGPSKERASQGHSDHAQLDRSDIVSDYPSGGHTMPLALTRAEVGSSLPRDPRALNKSLAWCLLAKNIDGAKASWSKANPTAITNYSAWGKRAKGLSPQTILLYRAHLKGQYPGSKVLEDDHVFYKFFKVLKAYQVCPAKDIEINIAPALDHFRALGDNSTISPMDLTKKLGIRHVFICST